MTIDDLSLARFGSYRFGWLKDPAGLQTAEQGFHNEWRTVLSHNQQMVSNNGPGQSRINVQTLTEGPQPDESDSVTDRYFILDPRHAGPVRCRLCGEDTITHTPNPRIIGKNCAIDRYLAWLKREDRLDGMITRIVSLGSRFYRPSDERASFPCARLPILEKQSNPLPIRSAIGMIKIGSDGDWSESIPLRGDAAIFRRTEPKETRGVERTHFLIHDGVLSRSPPKDGDWISVCRAPKPTGSDPACSIDSLRVKYNDDLLQIIANHPDFLYRDVVKRVPKPLRSKNSLRPWMIERVNEQMRTVRRKKDSAQQVDILKIYETYCQNREPPSDLVVSQSTCIGMTITHNFQSDFPSYVGLFLWPWGLWICPVDPSADPDYVHRATLQDILTKAALRNIPIVHSEDNLICRMSRIMSKAALDTCFPNFVQLCPPDGPEHTQLCLTAAGCFDIDVLSWYVFMNITRLSESVPKNPIFASYVPAWKLRYEQMAKMGCDALAAVCIFEHAVRLFKIRVSG